MRNKFLKIKNRILVLYEEHKKRIISGVIAVIFLAIAMAALGVLSDLLILLFLMLVAVLPTIYKRWIRMGIGIELMLFATVIAGLKYGLITGAVFGALAIIISDLMNGLIGEWTLLNSAAMAVGGVVAALTGNEHILITGMASFIAVEIIRQVPPIIIGGNREKFMSVFYTAVHLGFNLWLFSTIAPLIGF